MSDSQQLEYTASVERVSPVERKVAVEIPWSEVKGRLDEAYRELGKGVTLKGFRRGKVPRRMLQQLFGKHVDQEVAQRLVQDSITKVFGDHELKPVSEPDVDDDGITDGDAFRYSATVQVVPEIEPKDYFGVEVIQRPPEVTDEQVDTALEQKQRELTEYRAVEGRKTGRSDVLLVDVMGKVGDEPLDLEAKMVDLSEPQSEPLPGLAAKLEGIEPKEQDLELELDVPVHDHGPDEPCPGDERVQRARLLVSIRDVKEKVVPELDDELAKHTGEAQSLEELRGKLRDKLLEEDEKRARSEAKQRLTDKLLEVNDVPIVPALVERHLERVSRLQLMLMGIDPEQSGIDHQGIKERLREDAEKAVRAAMLIEAIAKKENVEVQDADIEKRLAELAADRDRSVAKLRAEYAKDGRLDQIRSNLREEKALDLLMAKANIIVREIPDDQGGDEGAGAEADGEAQAPQASTKGEAKAPRTSRSDATSG